MQVNFKLDENTFKCTNTQISSNALSINYIKCHFDITDPAWNGVSAIAAIFKSATYNKIYEVMLDSNNNCYIDPLIYKHGGTIQVKLVGDKYLDDDPVISSTHITAVTTFHIREDVILPTVIPSKYDVFVAEFEIAQKAVSDVIKEMRTKAENGYFDGEDGVGITSVTYNSNGTVNITLSDGTSYTSSYSMKGAKGDPGDDGVGISNVVYGDDGRLTITLTDGTTFTSAFSLKGTDGNNGEDGVGISRVEYQANGKLLITLTDGSSYISSYSMKGEKGDKGDPGSGPSNLVNGSAAGSVRSINSASEDDSYTIGVNAFAEGYSTEASGESAHAEGGSTKASGSWSHAEGYNTKALDGATYITGGAKVAPTHAEGMNTTASGGASHAEGQLSQATGDTSHAEGYSSTASGSVAHAEGRSSTASGMYAHAEGHQARSSGESAHAEGIQTTASGEAAHAEGDFCTASGMDSHAEGRMTEATELCSHAQNLGAVADQSSQTAIGAYNTRGLYGNLFVIGNGSSDSQRSDAFKVNNHGDVVIAGTLTIGSTTITETQLASLLALL